jgi:hypothetical protein
MFHTFSGKNIIKQTFFSDLNGLYNVAMLLDDMKYPWSDSSLLIGNKSENFWSIINATQGVHYLVVWLFCKLFPFVLAASLYLYVNWVLNGVMGFIVARELGSNKFGAMIVGLLLQMTPFVREKLFNHFVYGALGYILFVLYLAIKSLRQSNQNQTIYRLSFLLLIVGFGVFVDLLWFYSAALIFYITTLIILLQQRKTWYFTIFLVATLMLWQLIIKLTSFISQVISTTGIPNRNLAVTELGFIYQSGSSFKSFFSNSLNRDFEYGHTGIVVSSLVILGVFSLIRSNQRTETWFLSFIALFFAILTLSPTIRIFGNEIDTPIKFLRHIFPGVRFFDRFGFVAIVSLCIIAGLGLSISSKLIARPRLKVVIGLVILLLIVGDNHLLEKRKINTELSQYRPLREILRVPSMHTTGVLNVPIWNTYGDLVNNYPNTPMFLLGSKTFFSYKNDLWLKELSLFHGRGIDELTNFLLARGVTHIIENGPQTNIDLSSEHFSLVGHINGEKVRLYKINEVSGTSFCSICSPFFVESSFVGLPIFNPALKRGYEKIDSDIHWVEASSTKTLKVTSTNHDAEYRVSFRFVPWYGAAAKTNVVIIKAGKDAYSVPLFVGNIGKLSLSIKEGETIRLFSALGCHKGKDIDTQNIDTRSICFGIEAIDVKEISKQTP